MLQCKTYFFLMLFSYNKNKLKMAVKEWTDSILKHLDSEIISFGLDWEENFWEMNDCLCKVSTA